MDGQPFLALVAVLLKQDEGETHLFEFAVFVLNFHILHVFKKGFQCFFLMGHPPFWVLDFS